MKCAVILSCFIASVLTAPLASEESLRLVAQANRKFTAAVYQEMRKNNTGNMVFSPFSAQTILALLSEGTKFDTRKELLTALSLPKSKNSIHKGFKSILENLQFSKEFTQLVTANKIYVGIDTKLEDSFQQIATDIYQSEIENINFTNAKESASTINEWVEEKTNEKIKDFIQSNQFNNDTVLVLINALYLNAEWETSFADSLTYDQEFYLKSDSKISKPTMHSLNYFSYLENKELDAKFLDIAYNIDGLRMTIILPNQIEGLSVLEDNIEKVLEPQLLMVDEVAVTLPKFSIESDIQFVEILKSLGVKKIFSDGDITGLSSTNKDVYVSNIIQKTFLNVTETGTEAASSTGMFLTNRFGNAFQEEDIIFRADHPFMFLIQYNDVIIFAGRYVV